jgi:signal transduction histidine kinase
MAFMSIELQRGSVKIRCDCGDGVPAVDADESQLRQAFMNIVRNSFEALPGGGEIVIATRADDGRAVVTFQDTGAGIAPEHLARVFDPFFSTKESGIGLGLSLTHQIVSEHGGTITAASEKGKGTTFTVTLPGL